MTHDELLIEINRRLDVALYNGDPQSIHALRAVVELHKPWFMETGPEGDSETETVVGCECIPQLPAFLNPWPCPTIQAIEKELSNG
jgi:hypothetical protein